MRKAPTGRKMQPRKKPITPKKVTPLELSQHEKEPPKPQWVDFYDLLLGERHITTAQLADAVENNAFRGWDEYGRCLQFSPKNTKDARSQKALQNALSYLSEVRRLQLEAYSENFGQDDLTDLIPHAEFGWYANKLPSFGNPPPEQPKHGAAGGAMKGENYKLRIMGALIDLWTGHAVSPPEKTKAALVSWLTDIEEKAQCWDLKSPDAVKKQFDEIQKLLSGRLLFPADHPQLK
jgi:hypothetical protein